MGLFPLLHSCQVERPPTPPPGPENIADTAAPVTDGAAEPADAAESAEAVAPASAQPDAAETAAEPPKTDQAAEGEGEDSDSDGEDDDDGDDDEGDDVVDDGEESDVEDLLNSGDPMALADFGAMRLPIYNGIPMLRTSTDFQLPFDIWAEAS